MCDVWEVFLAGLDPVRVEQERFPALDVVRRESFYLPSHHRVMADHERDKYTDCRRVMASLESAEADVAGEVARQERLEAERRAWNRRKYGFVEIEERKVA